MTKRIEWPFMSGVVFLGVLFSLFSFYGRAYGSEDKFPSRPIQIYSGLAAGGTVGTVSTAISMIMPKYIGQPVVVNYKPGAMQIPAADFVANSKPDGYTLFTILEPDFISRILQDPPVDLKEGDFVALGGAGFTPFIMVTCKGRPWKSLEELIADAKKNPGEYTFGSTGIGGTSHIVMEVFQKEAGIKLVHVPFKGGAPRQTACLGGHIDTSSSTFMISGAHIKSGEQRALVIFDDHRNPKFPDVPTFREKGYSGRGGVWQKICAPKGLPKPIYDRLVEALRKTFNDPEFGPMLSKTEIDPVYFTPEESNKRTKEEYAISYEVLKKIDLLNKDASKK